MRRRREGSKAGIADGNGRGYGRKEGREGERKRRLRGMTGKEGGTDKGRGEYRLKLRLDEGGEVER